MYISSCSDDNDENDGRLVVRIPLELSGLIPEKEICSFLLEALLVGLLLVLFLGVLKFVVDKSLEGGVESTLPLLFTLPTELAVGCLVVNGENPSVETTTFALFSSELVGCPFAVVVCEALREYSEDALKLVSAVVAAAGSDVVDGDVAVGMPLMMTTMKMMTMMRNSVLYTE